ncbi:arylamine N-acetyltransferase [Streptomyces sp. M19]
MPFETVDFVERNMPSMDDEKVLDKIVRQRRGGGCGELNSGFALLLRALGFRVTLHGGRVLHNGKQAFRGVHNGHLVLRVEIDRPYLVDVGFRWAARRPLRFDDRGVQRDPHGAYQLHYTEHGDVEMVHDGCCAGGWRRTRANSTTSPR